MDTRRDFFEKVAMLTGGTGLASALLPAVERAASIGPADQSTYLDAEHIVILMQENRSFDHCFGTLRGVRGFNDPRAVTLPDGNPVWLQTNVAGKTYAPFRLDARETNATWLGSLPHSWTDQNDAKNGGDHDKWLIAKPTKRKDCLDMPLTMGYYNREDLPFYYALADAFTICDQNFCSSLTGTTPNRLYFWSGTVREEQHAGSPANLRNENVTDNSPAYWTTFPERLEDAGISWRIYQNELNLPSGLSQEEEAWLANFSDNPIEWFPQFAAKSAANHREYVAETNPSVTPIEHLPERARNLHQKAFTVNSADPNYRRMTTLQYQNGGVTRELQIPQGDILHQFREDVSNRKLPAISWLIAPEKFSDHPTAPWYGAWYVAETMNILTQNPDIWKKTIFILAYDENDGFFDHVPPFASPHPDKRETGLVSDGIDAAVEYVTADQDVKHKDPAKARGGSIGLGFRVPLIVASPWSRGGAVCSQVFDHTSVLQFLEKFASHKSGKVVRETNISEWRRTVCGDLTSVFQSAAEASPEPLSYPEKDAFIERIYNAQFKALPAYRALTSIQINYAWSDWRSFQWKPRQETGIRPARAIPYELQAHGSLTADRRSIQISLSAGNRRFGAKAAGSPFHVYTPGEYRHNGSPNRTRSYAVRAGQSLQDNWALAGFPGGRYHLCVCGPNGFLAELAGDADDPLLQLSLEDSPNQLKVALTNLHRQQSYAVSVVDHSYGMPPWRKPIAPGHAAATSFDLKRSHGWYDFGVRIEGVEPFERRYAGHIETGQPSFSDPAMSA